MQTSLACMVYVLPLKYKNALLYREGIRLSGIFTDMLQESKVLHTVLSFYNCTRGGTNSLCPVMVSDIAGYLLVLYFFQMNKSKRLRRLTLLR